MKKSLVLLLVTLFIATGILTGCNEQEQELDPIVEELSQNHVGPATEPFSDGPTEAPGA